MKYYELGQEADIHGFLHEAIEEYKKNYSQSKADPIWKATIEHLWADCLRLFFPDADNIFDFSHTPEFLDKELLEITPNPENGPNRTYADSIMKVRMKTGSYSWILIHFEAQGYSNPDFGKLMFKRFRRLVDKYEDYPVAAVVIATEKDLYLPDRYEISCFDTHLSYSYKVYNVCDQDEAILEASNNPFAHIILIAKQAAETGKQPDTVLMEQKIAIFRNLLRKKFTKGQIENLYVFLYNYVHFVKRQMNSTFINEVKQITKNHTSMTLQEYHRMALIEEAQILAKEEFESKQEQTILNLHHKLGLSNEQIADVANVSLAFVIQALKRHA